MMDNWIIVSNCQTYGLANTLQAQTDGVKVEGIDILLFQSSPEFYLNKIEQSDRLLISRDMRNVLIDAGLSDDKPWTEVPAFIFRAYHPDLTYIKCRGVPLDGAVNHYHSAIVYACFKAGMDEHEAVKRFNGDLFERCGYLDLWLDERDRLVRDMAGIGIDIAAPIRRWGRGDSFMYSINHPKIRVLRDIARELIRNAGLHTIDGVEAHDNLASGPHFAVYPEIAESLGVSGGYVFKNADSYRPFGLEEFVHRSYASYSAINLDDVEHHPHVEYILSIL